MWHDTWDDDGTQVRETFDRDWFQQYLSPYAYIPQPPNRHERRRQAALARRKG